MTPNQFAETMKQYHEDDSELGSHGLPMKTRTFWTNYRMKLESERKYRRGSAPGTWDILDVLGL